VKIASYQAPMLPPGPMGAEEWFRQATAAWHKRG
jgi:hypothetical protein